MMIILADDIAQVVQIPEVLEGVYGITVTIHVGVFNVSGVVYRHIGRDAVVDVLPVLITQAATC